MEPAADKPRETAAFRHACAGGHLAMAQWAAAEFAVSPAQARESGALRAACVGGHLDVAKWLVETFGLTAADARAAGALRAACAGGHLGAAKWLAERFGLSAADVHESDHEIARAASARGDLMVLRWAYGSFAPADPKTANRLLLVACRRGQVAAAAWLRRRAVSTTAYPSIRDSAITMLTHNHAGAEAVFGTELTALKSSHNERGHIPLERWLAGHPILDAVARGDLAALVAWIDSTLGATPKKQCAQYSAGHWHYLYGHFIRIASEYGHLNIIQHLSLGYDTAHWWLMQSQNRHGDWCTQAEYPLTRGSHGCPLIHSFPFEHCIAQARASGNKELFDWLKRNAQRLTGLYPSGMLAKWE